MGFDISYHPISLEDMNEWYFERLLDAAKDDYSKLLRLGRQHHMDKFYVNKYMDTIKVAVQTGKEDDFFKTHAYYLAVVHGFFDIYYYTRGTAFSFLIEEQPKMKSYITSWQEIKPYTIRTHIEGGLTENYSGGIYLSPEQVKDLLADYEKDDNIYKIMNDFFEQNISIFIKALQNAAKKNKGLLEASEVVEPQPLDLSKSTAVSNLANCDEEGPLLYQKIALKQIKDYTSKVGLYHPTIIDNAQSLKVVPSEEKRPKKGIWKKIFKKS